MALSYYLYLSARSTLRLISSKIPIIPQHLSLPKGWDSIALYILFFIINSTLIMKSLKIMLGVIFMLFVALSARASEGEYDLRFVQIESGQAGVALIDIEMRFSFNEDAVFPYNANQPSITIEQELSASGQVAQSFYAPHHLNGSARNFISYNVELVGGEGIRISTDEWTKIASRQLTFQKKETIS